jgi:hypothetical protein
MTFPRRLESLTQRVRARTGPAAADDLDRCWWAAELDGTRHDRAVRTWDTPPADCPTLAGLAVVHHHLAGQWLEEEHPAEGQAVHRVRLGRHPGRRGCRLCRGAAARR